MGEERRRVELNPEWRERYFEDSAEKEAELFRVFAEQIQHVQERNRGRQGEPLRRAFHAKPLAGIVNARFTVAVDVRAELRSGLFVPGASYPALVRFSNASVLLEAIPTRTCAGSRFESTSAATRSRTSS